MPPPNAATVHETLPNGTVWDLCWHMDERAGLVLENVSVAYASKPEATQVLQSIRLAQLNVPYDSGDTEYNDLTDYGFGGGDLETLKSEDCKGGSWCDCQHRPIAPVPPVTGPPGP